MAGGCVARIDGWKMQFFSTKGTVCEALWHFGNDVVDFFLMLPGRYSNLNQFLHSKKSCRTIHDVVFFSKGGKISDFFFTFVPSPKIQNAFLSQ